MIKISKGRKGWWFDGRRFSDTRDMQTPVSDVDGLRLALVERAFRLNRWQGESGHGGPVSMGTHSILVAVFAANLAIVRGRSDLADLAGRLGGLHDLGEMLGMGDIAAPWLRSGRIDDAHDECAAHQEAAEVLFLGEDYEDDAAVTCHDIVKAADRAAAAYERRVFFWDDTGECEHPEALNILAKIGFRPGISQDEPTIWPTVRLGAVPHQIERLWRICTDAEVIWPLYPGEAAP